MLIVLWGTLESNIDDNQDENEERVRDISTHVELDITQEPRTSTEPVSLTLTL